MSLYEIINIGVRITSAGNNKKSDLWPLEFGGSRDIFVLFMTEVRMPGK
jgi:hypothetical protein